VAAAALLLVLLLMWSPWKSRPTLASQPPAHGTALISGVPPADETNAAPNSAPEPSPVPTAPAEPPGPAIRFAGSTPDEPLAGQPFSVRVETIGHDGTVTFDYRSGPAGDWQPVLNGRIVFTSPVEGPLSLEVQGRNSQGGTTLLKQEWIVKAVPQVASRATPGSSATPLPPPPNQPPRLIELVATHNQPLQARPSPSISPAATRMQARA
jgi:hypothetical protein